MTLWHDQIQGRLHLKSVTHQMIRDNRGQMPLRELLECLRVEGYNPERVREVLPRLDLVVDDDGMVRIQLHAGRSES